MDLHARSFAPNVYVSAFLVKDPHLESAEAFMPDRAFGVASVPLEPTDFTQTVKLTCPRRSRSNGTLPVNLELGPLEGPTFATVAAVDEGILSLTRFKSPDPAQGAVRQARPGRGDLRDHRLDAAGAPARQLALHRRRRRAARLGRVQPVKPVALWSGVVPVPAGRQAAQCPSSCPCTAAPCASWR